MKKCIAICKSILPTFLWFAVQIIVIAGFSGMMFLLPGIFRALEMNGTGVLKYLEQEWNYIVSVCINGVYLIPGIFWYRRLCIRELPWDGRREKAGFTGKAWLRLFILGLCMQLLVSLALAVAQILFPETMNAYGEVLEQLGVNAPSFWSVLYVGVLAPITEELIFRGLTLKILIRECSFPAANLIQAFYFALIHGNLVQGLYAFALGLVLGRVAYRYGTLKSSILCHSVVNVSGLLLGYVPMSYGTMASGSVALICLLVLLRERKSETV